MSPGWTAAAWSVDAVDGHAKDGVLTAVEVSLDRGEDA